MRSHKSVVLLTSILLGTSVLSYSITHDLYKHSSQKTCGQYFFTPMKDRHRNYYDIIKVWWFFSGRFSLELTLTFIYFSSQSSELLVIDLIKSMILLCSSSYFKSVFAFISRDYCQIFIFVSFFNVTTYFIHNKVQRFYTFRYHKTNVINKNALYDFWSILILFRSRFFILIMSSKK